MQIEDMQIITDDQTPKKEKKTEFLFIKVSPSEKAKIERNMALLGITNISAFVRRMCLDGGIFKVDLPEIQEVSRLMNITANNVNQLTKRVNGGGTAYSNDIAEMNEQLTECRGIFGKIMAKLAKYLRSSMARTSRSNCPMRKGLLGLVLSPLVTMKILSALGCPAR